MSIAKPGWIHFTDKEMVKVCDFLDENDYQYEVDLLKSPADKNRPWSIKPEFETQLQADRYAVFLNALKLKGLDV